MSTNAPAPAPVLPDTRTSPKHEQGSYMLPDGSVRVIYGQRVLGQVRLTDEPQQPGGGARAYLIERCVETDARADGTSALAHMNAIVADYLDQAQRLQRCPLERASLLTDTRATTMLAPKAVKDSPFEVMVKFGASTWEDAIKARAAARREATALAAAVAS
jgi:hypothetical protein